MKFADETNEFIYKILLPVLKPVAVVAVIAGVFYYAGKNSK